MRIAMFYHSLVSDWNHGNAHFLRGIVTELLARGHHVDVYEPADSWSRTNLIEEHGLEPIRKFQAAYPKLKSIQYDLARFELERALDGADLVIVHEWSAHELVRRIGEHHARNEGYCLLFHDTHHRMVTEPASMERYDLDEYDGVLAYGNVLRELYESTGRVRNAWTWHEAADVRVFRPIDEARKTGDLVWVGNWGDGERTAELQEFLIQPVKNLKLRASIHGVRYPDAARQELGRAGIDYEGWLPNFEAPSVFAAHKVTVHVPRRPYVEALPGIPTIRPFEALACGIPLICSPWNDCEKLFRPGVDYLRADNRDDLQEKIHAVLSNPTLAQSLREHGLETIRTRHTCAHRVDELLNIFQQIKGLRAQEGNNFESAQLVTSNSL
jgi:spore maturation protein CgeB